MKKGPFNGYLSFFDQNIFPYFVPRGTLNNLQMLHTQNLPTLLYNVNIIFVKYTLIQYNTAQYCRQELCCGFPYRFRLSKAKDRCIKDEGGRCPFCIDIYSLVPGLEPCSCCLLDGNRLSDWNKLQESVSRPGTRALEGTRSRAGTSSQAGTGKKLYKTLHSLLFVRYQTPNGRCVVH